MCDDGDSYLDRVASRAIPLKAIMNKSQAGRKGAKVTKARHGVEICKSCGQLILTDFYSQNGEKGGQETLQTKLKRMYAERQRSMAETKIKEGGTVETVSPGGGVIEI